MVFFLSFYWGLFVDGGVYWWGLWKGEKERGRRGEREEERCR
jgi:hypothetical protein